MTSSPTFDNLAVACDELARTIKWSMSEPAPVSEVEQLAYRIRRHAESLMSLDVDRRLLARAVLFINGKFGQPGGDVKFYENALEVLVELAMPDGPLEGDAAEFLADLREGIDESIESAKK